MRMWYRTIIMVLIGWTMLVIAYNYLQRPSFVGHYSKRLMVVVKSQNVGEENNDHIHHNVSNERRVVFYATTSRSLDLEAEMESKKRKESVDKVCQKFNVTLNILEPPADPKERLKAEQRFSSFRKHLILNEEHKVLFCFIPKVSCTTMKKLFVVMDNLYPSIEKVRVVDQTVVRFNDKKFTEEQRQHMLKNFYKFMIVRDPFERLVSAYQSKFKKSRYGVAFPHIVNKIIKKYRENTTTVETGYHVSFTEYVRHLIDTPARQLNDHWMSYEELCRPCDVKYDFIGSIDTLERDVKHAMRQIHANETKCRVEQASSRLGKTKQATARFFKKLPRKYFDQLLAIRKTDFQLFGYPLPEYQTLDKNYHA